MCPYEHLEATPPGKMQPLGQFGGGCGRGGGGRGHRLKRCWKTLATDRESYTTNWSGGQGANNNARAWLLRKNLRGLGPSRCAGTKIEFISGRCSRWVQARCQKCWQSLRPETVGDVPQPKDTHGWKLLTKPAASIIQSKHESGSVATSRTRLRRVTATGHPLMAYSCLVKVIQLNTLLEPVKHYPHVYTATLLYG